MKESKLQSIFTRPDDEYRPVLMWFWNAMIKEDEIRRQIQEFKKQKIYEFFVHPSYGFEMDYLSEEYFELVGVAVDEAKIQGMRFWIYDENSWPSGLAGGHVLKEYPESRMTILLYARFKVAPQSSIRLNQPGKWLASFVFYNTHNDINETNFETIESDCADWRNPTDSVAILLVYRIDQSKGVHPACRWASFTWDQEGTLDSCRRESVRHFIDLTHEAYAQRFGEEFGETIVGVFTDEPILSTGWFLQYPAPFTGLPWYPGLLSEFKKKYGYDLKEKLPQLALPLKDCHKTRYHYWLHLTEAFSDSYACQISEWCEQHRIRLTGHINYEEYLLAAVYSSGDLYRVLKWFHYPGMDSIATWLHLDLDETVIPPKLVSSIAHQQNKQRVLSETFTGSGWDLTFEGMKRSFDRLAVLGVNLLQLMGAYYSIKGFRKLPPDASWPPSHSYQNSLFPYYHKFSDYVAGVCGALTQGHHDPKVAVLYPIASAWDSLRFGHEQWCEEDPQYAMHWDIFLRTFTGLTRCLLEIQTDFDFVFEETLRGATIEEDTLRIGEEHFRFLILPACTFLENGIFEKIEEFVTAGGQVLFLNGVPTVSQDGSDVSERLKSKWNIQSVRIKERMNEIFSSNCLMTEQINGLHPAINVMLTNCLSKEDREQWRDQLRQLFGKEAANLWFTPANPHLYVHQRRVEDESLICVVNTSKDTYDGAIHLPRCELFELYRPDSNTSESLRATKLDDQWMEVNIKIGQYELVFLRTGESPKNLEETPSLTSNSNSNKSGELVLIEEWEMKPLYGNLLPLTFCVREADNSEIDVHINRDKLENFLPCPDHRFVEGLPVIKGIGSGWGALEGQSDLTCFCPGKSYWVMSEFEIENVPNELKLVMEDIGVDSIFLNEHRLVQWKNSRVWDESNLETSIVSHVKSGKNQLFFQCKIPEWKAPHSLPMFAFWGDFEVNPQGSIVRSILSHSTGDWRTQGYPRFSGSMNYSQEFEFSELPLQTPAYLVIDNAAEVVEAKLNDQPLGSRLWQPYRFSIGGILCKGTNKIQLKVTNTSSNLFAEPMPSGLLGLVRILW